MTPVGGAGSGCGRLWTTRVSPRSSSSTPGAGFSVVGRHERRACLRSITVSGPAPSTILRMGPLPAARGRMRAPLAPGSPVGNSAARRAEKSARGERAHGEPLSRGLRGLDARPRGVLGRGGAGDRVDRAAEDDLRQAGRRLRPLVPRRGAATPASIALDRHVRGGPRRPGRRSIYDSAPITGFEARPSPINELLDETCDVLGAALAGLSASSAGDRVHDLHADDSPHAHRRDARLQRRIGADAFGGVRRLRSQGACDPHRRRRAEGHSQPASLRRRAQAGSSNTSRCSILRLLSPGIKARSACVDPPASADQRGDERDPAATTTGTTLVDAARAAARKGAECVADLAATDPLYILYTSGTTGRAERRGARHQAAIWSRSKWSMGGDL